MSPPSAATSLASVSAHGLLTAAMAFAAGGAVLTSRIFPRWAALFLCALLIAQLTVTGIFDSSALTMLSGPYSLFALALATSSISSSISNGLSR